MTFHPRKTRFRRRSAARAGDGPPFSTMARGKKKLGRNKKRSAKNAERAYGAKADWIRERSCHNCGKGPDASRWIVAAHIKNGGMGRKSDSRYLIPLCETANRRGCHDDQHQHGWAFLYWLQTADERENAAAHYEAEFHSHLARSSERPTGE